MKFLKNIIKLIKFIFYNKLNKTKVVSLSKIKKFSKVNLIEVIDKAGGLTIQELVSILEFVQFTWYSFRNWFI